LNGRNERQEVPQRLAHGGNSIDTAMHRAIHSRDGREPVSSF